MNKLKLLQVKGQGMLAAQILMACLLLLAFSSASYAQYPPSHDPSTMVRNTDGRYWIFTTGEGVWAMSSSNRDFTNWRAEPTPFAPGTWPSWINNYVTGFNGHFWAPDVIKVGNTYYLYYSCAGQGAAAAIGLATATNLAGPWTDRGMVVAGDNAIDPVLLLDNGRLWMSWGNWQSGIDITELSTSSGKRVGGIAHLVSGQVEGPGLVKNGGYYYLFYQRGLCCNGVNSSYYVVVARSTNITGPYTGERVFLPNRNGNIIGPGHIGYGEGRLTYHFYDGNDNGNAKLMVRSDFGFANGWPYLGAPPSSGGGGDSVVQLRNRGTGLYLDGMGNTTNGAVCAQYANTSHPNSQWQRIDVGSGYFQLRNVGTGLYLDGMGRTTNGEDVGQWTNTTHQNSHWTIQQYSGNYYQIRNRGTGLYLDGMGRTSNGSACGQWANTTHVNSQWELINISGSRVATEQTLDESSVVFFYPNPVEDVLNLRLEEEESAVARIVNLSGQLMVEKDVTGVNTKIDVSSLSKGVYFVELSTLSGTRRMKLLKQ